MIKEGTAGQIKEGSCDTILEGWGSKRRQNHKDFCLGCTGRQMNHYIDIYVIYNVQWYIANAYFFFSRVFIKGKDLIMFFSRHSSVSKNSSIRSQRLYHPKQHIMQLHQNTFPSMQFHGCIALFNGVSEIGQQKQTKTQKHDTHTHMQLKKHLFQLPKNHLVLSVWKIVNPKRYWVGFHHSNSDLLRFCSFRRLLATSSVEHVLPGGKNGKCSSWNKRLEMPWQTRKAKIIQREREVSVSSFKLKRKMMESRWFAMSHYVFPTEVCDF